MAGVQPRPKKVEDPLTLDDFTDVKLLREGRHIAVPEEMPLRVAGDWLHRQAEEEEREVNVYEVIEAFPLDAVHAFMMALKEIYGWTGLAPTPGFFGPRPPMMFGLAINAKGDTVQVPWGNIVIPGVEGRLTTQMSFNEERRARFVLAGTVKQKHLSQIGRIAARTRELVRERSIYKGKAIRVAFPDPDDVDMEDVNPTHYQPRFLDLSRVAPDELVLPTATERIVETTLFAPIERTQWCRDAQIPLKRGVLLEGTYGTGKTLTAYVTAKKCEDNGWTFIYLEDVRRLDLALGFAKQYAPAVVFAEDIDRADSDGARSDQFNTIMNAIDSVAMKNTEVMVVLTTNNVEKIHKGMLRPGRLDAVIPVRPPDALAAQRLVRLYARGMMAPTEDLTAVGEKLNGLIPAVIREVVERSKLAAIARMSHEGHETMPDLTLKSPDLETAADTMIEHMAYLKEVPEDNRTPIEKGMHVMGTEIRKGVEKALTQGLSEHAAAKGGNGSAYARP